jgi:hypothetical protein
MKLHVSLLSFSACYALGQDISNINNEGPCQNPRIRRSWFVYPKTLNSGLTRHVTGTDSPTTRKKSTFAPCNASTAPQRKARRTFRPSRADTTILRLFTSTIRPPQQRSRQLRVRNAPFYVQRCSLDNRWRRHRTWHPLQRHLPPLAQVLSHN